MKTKIIRKSILVYCVTVAILFLIMLPYKVTAEERRLVPLGKTVGITAKLSGISIVNVTEFENSEGKICSPASNAGLMPEDIIISIDGREINSVKELESFTDNSNGKKITIAVLRDGEKKEIDVFPAKSRDDNKYRIGVWIKDASSGIGTITYYDAKTGEFGALGHGICDENDRLINISEGDIFETEVTSIMRGEKGKPGELIALFSDDRCHLGKVNKNTEYGIFGNLTSDIIKEAPLGEIPIASRSEVKEGEVTILSNVEGKNIAQYSAEICRINKDTDSTKGMIVKITDNRLIEKTGGIVRGLSGSPIIQNGKLVGAVTHVCVNL